MKYVKLIDIDLGKESHAGHTIYRYAKHKRTGKSVHIIAKQNKRNRPFASQLETAFSQIANLLLTPQLSSEQKLIIDETSRIWGTAVEDICYAIHSREKQRQSYCRLSSLSLDYQLEEVYVNNAEAIPSYFFDTLPQGFFARLLNNKNIEIDYSSLANVMTTSYTLEEDDLHKANFGFYIVSHPGKKEVKFFKIDHDLMFIDSIMSFCSTRFFHWMQAENAFDITKNDLLNFPILTDSSNAYWPTKKSKTRHPNQEKEYLSDEEVKAFMSLAQNEAFNKAKWIAFYKQIVMPVCAMEESLKDCFDANKPEDCAKSALVLHAMIGRQARLKAVLLSLPEFRDFISQLSADEKQSILTDIAKDNQGMRTIVEESITNFSNNHYGFVSGDTPLHVAIKLGDFRSYETLQMFGKYTNKANALGESPIDVAVEKAKNQSLPVSDIRQDYRFMIHFLRLNGAKATDSFNAFNKTDAPYEYQSSYLERAKFVGSYEELKRVLKDIGEEKSYCLKFKKDASIACINACIKANPPQLRDILSTLHQEINAPVNKVPQYSYIHQLRSHLWIIRQLRGLYGYTSTRGAINQIINQSLTQLKQEGLGFSSQ